MLRTLILFVVFLNLAFYYWARENNFDRQAWIQPKNVGDHNSILLISEKPAIRNEDAQALVAEPEIKRELMCFSIGPFEESDASDEMYAVLFDLGVQAQQRIVNQRKPKSYWVYLPSNNSKAKADETVEFLNKNGVDETYIWLDTPHQYDVSLGLFSRLTTARNILAQIEALGLTPKMDVRYTEITEFWVDYQHDLENAQPKELEELFRDNQRLLVIESVCP
ncbi:MAG: hypothetical protein AAGB35_09935 [Pseudomonadota bacterium]